MRRRGTLGPTLRRLRHGGSRGRQATAESAAISEDRLEAIEDGRAFPSIPELRAICEALELSMRDRFEVQRAQRETAAMIRANPWMAKQLRAS